MAAEHAFELVTGPLKKEIGTLCVHGDAIGAKEIVRAIREKFRETGIFIAPFCGHSPHGMSR